MCKQIAKSLALEEHKRVTAKQLSEWYYQQYLLRDCDAWSSAQMTKVTTKEYLRLNRECIDKGCAMKGGQKILMDKDGVMYEEKTKKVIFARRVFNQVMDEMDRAFENAKSSLPTEIVEIYTENLKKLPINEDDLEYFAPVFPVLVIIFDDDNRPYDPFMVPSLDALKAVYATVMKWMDC
jgi:hypothetical protein